ncbi:MBL fold metallo-hydrolase [Corallococcus silvisoli]|uniref:MBL fold metallo-hydrolase n=1 Tax=Corallococcus silvisoli TaxID=2697031 RepID=UPI0013781FC6|nr:MBL fold metallo-hydrolase [Corallococcus silvisoli]NBD08717.1 MBL fold metallo-hydrolase [Corallococcus silvisoli]
MRLTLHRGVSLAVLASARTEADHHEDLGCSIQGPTARPVRRAQLPLKRHIAALGREGALREAQALIRWLEQTPRYAALCQGTKRRMGRRVLREDVLFPDPLRHRPRVLHLRQESLGLDVPVRAKDWPAVADLFAALARGATREELRVLASAPVVGELLGDLSQAGWLTRHAGPVRVPAPGALFVGHNTVLVSGREGRVLVDPYFRPAGDVDLPGYAPLQAGDLGRVDAVVITHSHGDHFHLGSLLPLPRDTRIFVPAVARESLFSTDCALRLAQLGFSRVEALRWGEQRQVGDVTVHALPFHGEQPTDGEGPHPDLFNEGNTWLVRSPDFSAAFFADAGHDVRGDMDAVCRRVRKQQGPVDVLFCGVRGFRLPPIFFGFTTLDAFLVNVPRDALTTPQRLMAGPEEALRYGQLLGARYVVPCADGGAPWYWREGMGPRYAGYPGEPVAGASAMDENPDADPYPERLAQVREERGEGPEALLLRPGEALRWRGKRKPEVSRTPGFEWPFGDWREPALQPPRSTSRARQRAAR